MNTSVLLDCEHVVWFKQANHAPRPGDTVWCAKCQHYQQVPDHDRERGTYYPDGDWYCFKRGRKCLGRCNRCQHEHTAPFHTLRTYMEKHHRSGCKTVTEGLVFTYQPLPPNSPPPF